MSKKQLRKISVVTVFEGKQDRQQAFIDLILNKQKNEINNAENIEKSTKKEYSEDKVFSDVYASS